MTRTERLNYHYMADAMRRLEWDLHHAIHESGRIPQEWHEIATERAPKKRVRVTLGVEEDVLKFFRSMGEGYQPRMNAVLRAFMHGRLAGVIRGGETMEYFRAPEDARPRWGAEQAELAELIGPEAACAAGEGPGVPIGEEPPGTAERLAEMRRRLQALPGAVEPA
jgi:uncharacterized protein (DUF4415 family)